MPGFELQGKTNLVSFYLLLSVKTIVGGVPELEGWHSHWSRVWKKKMIFFNSSPPGSRCFFFGGGVIGLLGSLSLFSVYFFSGFGNKMWMHVKSSVSRWLCFTTVESGGLEWSCSAGKVYLTEVKSYLEWPIHNKVRQFFLPDVSALPLRWPEQGMNYRPTFPVSLARPTYQPPDHNRRG